MLEQPGPPLNHVASGAVDGFERASKLSSLLDRYYWYGKRNYVQPEPHVHIRPHGEVSRVLVHARSSLTDTGVGNKVQLSAGCSVFEDSTVGSISLNKGALVFPT